MARKPKQEEHVNHERWLVSYADFITLLFAFFVVMYSISSVNEGKYRVLSSSLFSAFNDPAKSLDPIQYGTPLRSPIVQHKSMLDDDDAISRVGVDHQVMPSRKQLAEMQKIADEIEYNLKKLVAKDLITVNKTNLGVEIEIKSSILFGSGSANLEAKAKPVLQKIANILSKVDNDINVEGFTDDIPIHTLIYPSNWELSAARASSVVRLFSSSNIDSKRLKAIGFAEFRAIADNSTPEGRNKNRRVTIFLLNTPESKRVKILEKKTTKNDISKDHKINALAKHKEIPSNRIGFVTPTPVKTQVKSLVKSPLNINNRAQRLPTKLGSPRLINPSKETRVSVTREKSSKPRSLPIPKLITIGKEVQ